MTLWHSLGANAQGEPFVQLMADDQLIGQLSPEECRKHARAMTDAAERVRADRETHLMKSAETKHEKRDRIRERVVRYEMYVNALSMLELASFHHYAKAAIAAVLFLSEWIWLWVRCGEELDA